MDTVKLIDLLNKMLEQEHACSIRYATHAAVVTGPFADVIKARLKEIAADEILHADQLRERILALGGTPSMQVSVDDLKAASNISQMLDINIAEEKGAIAAYRQILKLIPNNDVILYKTIEDILRDEQEHLEELTSLIDAN